jgi:hypothetical protein
MSTESVASEYDPVTNLGSFHGDFGPDLTFSGAFEGRLEVGYALEATSDAMRSGELEFEITRNSSTVNNLLIPHTTWIAIGSKSITVTNVDPVEITIRGMVLAHDGETMTVDAFGRFSKTRH